MNLNSNASGSDTLLWGALALYGVTLIFAVWRLAVGRTYHRWIKMGLVLPGFFCHTLFLWQRGLADGRCPVSNLFETVSFIAWCLVALHLVITLVGELNYLTIFYMPIVIVIQLAGLIVPDVRPQFQDWQHSSWLGLHASVIIMGYAAFGLAGAVALMYLVQEKQLRTRRLSPSFMLFPPILRLELVQNWLVFSGFILLTLGLVSGFLGFHRTQPVQHWDPKLSWSLGVWVMYLIYLLGRAFAGLQGRRMAWFSILSWVFVVSTFWVVNVLSQFHNY